MTRDDLLDRIASFRGRVRRLLGIYGLARVAAIALAVVLAAGWADWAIHVASPIRALELLALIIVSAWALRRFVLRPMMANFDDLALALRIEDRWPGLQDRLASAVEFLAIPEQAQTSDNASPALRKRVIDQAFAEVESLDFTEAIDPRPARQSLKFLGIAAALAAFSFVLGPASSRIALARFFNPVSGPEWPKSTVLEWVEATPKVAVGEPWSLVVKVAEGYKVPASAMAEFRFVDGETASEPLRILENGEFRGRLESVTQSFSVRVRGGDDLTDAKSIVAVTPPRLADAAIEIVPPAYTAMPPVRLAPGSAQVRAVEGSTVKLTARATKSLSAANLKFADSKAQPPAVELDTARQNLNVSWEAAASTAVSLDLTDTEGFTSKDQGRLDQQVVPDMAPRVVLEDPATDREITAQAVVPLKVDLEDDFGIAEVRLRYQLSNGSEEPGEPIVRTLWSAVPGQPMVRKNKIGEKWDLAPMGLAPGAMITLTVEAVDFKKPNGPNLGKSREIRLRIITPQEAARQMEDQRREIREETERVLAMQRQANRPVDEARRTLDQTGDPAKLADASRQELQNAEQVQRQVGDRLNNPADGLSRKVERFLEDLDNLKLANPEAAEQMNGLKQALAQLEQGPVPQAEQALGRANRSIDQRRGTGDQSQRPGTQAPQQGAQRQGEQEQAKADGQQQGGQEQAKAGGQQQGGQEQAKAGGQQQGGQEKSKSGGQQQGGQEQAKAGGQQQGGQEKSKSGGQQQGGQQQAKSGGQQQGGQEQAKSGGQQQGGQEQAKSGGQQQGGQEQAKSGGQQQGGQEQAKAGGQQQGGQEQAKSGGQQQGGQEQAKAGGQQPGGQEQAKAGGQQQGGQQQGGQEQAGQEQQGGTQQSLAQAQDAQREVTQALERMLGEMSQLESVRGLINETKQIAAAQEEANKALEEVANNPEMMGKNADQLPAEAKADLENRAARQNELARQLQNLQERLGEMANRMAEQDPIDAAGLQEAAQNSRDRGTTGKMNDAAAQIAANRTNAAREAQQQALKEVQQLADDIQNRKEKELARLVKQLKESEQAIRDLKRAQVENLMKTRQAGQEKDDAKRKAELQKLARQEQQIQEEVKRQLQKLQRIRSAQQAARAGQQAMGKMSKAQQQMDADEAEGAQQEQEEALKNLDDAEQELAQARAEAEEQLAQEQFAKMGDLIKSLAERQVRMVEDTVGYDAKKAEAGSLTAAQRAGVRSLAMVEDGLKQETDELAERMGDGVPVFSLILKKASDSMNKATSSLQKLDTGVPTQKAEKSAAQRLQQLVDSLQPDKPKEGQGQQQQQQQGGEQQGGQQDGDGIPTVAQLKMLKRLQTEINERTGELDGIARDGGKLSDDQKTELDSLKLEQGRLADLLRDLSKPKRSDGED
ncbi:DUF4175 family protein [bacterium]|nr:DUF4175 family protein [bacterium]